MSMKNHILRIEYHFVPIVTKQLFLIFSLLLCFLVSSCNVFKELASIPPSSKINTTYNTSNSDVLALGPCYSPIKGKIISPFGYRGNHRHTGVDIKFQRGDTVRAAFDGMVTKAAPYYGYGNLVILKHSNNAETYYAHLSKCLVEEGATVVAGEVIGLVGRTGRATTDHLHFELRFNKVPKNPENFFAYNSGIVKSPIAGYTPSFKIQSQEKTEPNYSSRLVKIQKGDTFYSLAKRYGVTVKQLQNLNRLNSSNLRVGMKLKLS